MRGSPPVQLALLLAGFLLVAVPLMQLTNARNVEPGAAVPETVESQAATAATVRVRFAHRPAGLSIKHGDRDLLQGVDASESPVETGVELVIPKEGIEFQVSARWPEGTPDTALTVELEPDAMDAQSQTRWSVGGAMQETFVFQWKP